MVRCTSKKKTNKQGEVSRLEARDSIHIAFENPFRNDDVFSGDCDPERLRQILEQGATALFGECARGRGGVVDDASSDVEGIMSAPDIYHHPKLKLYRNEHKLLPPPRTVAFFSSANRYVPASVLTAGPGRAETLHRRAVHVQGARKTSLAGWCAIAGRGADP
jgi:hypothetical protein